MAGPSGGALRWLLALCLLLTGAAQAADDDNRGAAETLRETTEAVLAVIDSAEGYVDEDPQRYYRAVHEVLDPVVDFRGFARGVMGDYATSDRYRSLDPAGREQLRDQLERFTETMRKGLVRTYSKGLLAFNGSRVDLDEDGSREEGGRATLRQFIYSDEAEPYVVTYTMARGQDGRWLIRNLIVEDVNLGKIYRSQFESSARNYDGDLDKVISNWNVEGLDS
ncbi:MlaC/ttg2D family ABC transporter substrate-binding protein [Pseudohaliea rubra]|nr:ABC transporter substrate-binding protein [Pseudohaliea rubra]